MGSLPSLKAQSYFSYVISLKDKPAYTGNKPLLSPKAYERRAKYNIAIDERDFPINHALADSIISLVNGQYYNHSRWLNHVIVYTNDTSKIAIVRSLPQVRDVKLVGSWSFDILKGIDPSPQFIKQQSPDVLFNIAPEKNDRTFYGQMWPMIEVVNGHALHALGYYGQGITIAMLDNGFKEQELGGSCYQHLSHYGLIQDHYNFVRKSENVFYEGEHGTAMFSLMATYLPTQHVGTAPAARYHLYTTEDNFGEQRIELYHLLAGAERADSIGADIITVSLGYTTFSGLDQNDFDFSELDGATTIATKALNIATEKGIVCVASAGNEGTSDFHRIGAPSDGDSVIAVGNLKSDLLPHSSSSYGPNAKGAVKPNVSVIGQQAVKTLPGDCEVVWSGGGTSSAAPQIAGWIACLLEAKPTLTPYEIRTTLERSAHLYPQVDSQQGYGIPNLAKCIEWLGVQPKPETNWLLPEALFFIYPNPSLGTQLAFRIVPKGLSKYTYQVADITGKTIYTGQFVVDGNNLDYKVEWPFALSTGMYFVTINDGVQEQTQKWMVIN